MIDTIIFDLDGTLLDTIDDLADTMIYIQKKHGFEVHTKEQVQNHVGNGIARLVALSIPEGEKHPDFSGLVEEFKAYYAIHCNDKTKAYPGIRNMMKDFQKKGYKMAIVSNKADPAVKELNRIYFSDVITVAIGENEAAGIRKKPAPDTVFQALEELGSNTDHAVYVGDSEVDILTAQNAHMPCILCEWGFREKEFLIEKGGKHFMKHPDQLEELLQHI